VPTNITKVVNKNFTNIVRAAERKKGRELNAERRSYYKTVQRSFILYKGYIIADDIINNKIIDKRVTD